MKTFTDATGRTWSIVADVNALRRVKDLTGVDLLSQDGMRRATTCDDLWQFLELWPDILWALCLPQCQSLDVTQQAWAELLLADASEGESPVFDGAVNAALLEFANFFHKVGRHTAAAALSKIVHARTVGEMQVSESTAKLLESATTREIEAMRIRIEKGLRSLEAESETPGETSTSSPESSESTPGP